MERKRIHNNIGNQRNDPNSSTSTRNIFGGNTVQVSGDGSSLLIGSVIEKGISENQLSFGPTPPPNSTVLPFPVARHRSHGPHWGPMSSKTVAYNSNGNGEDGEDTDSTEFDRISAFAKPVERKQKKGLNLSQWRNVISSDTSVEVDKMEVNRQQFRKSGKHLKDVQPVDNIGKSIIACDSSLVDKTPVELDVTPPHKIGESILSDMEIYNSHQQRHIQDSTESMYDTGGPKTHVEKMVKTYPALRDTLKKREQTSSTVVSTSNLNNITNEHGTISIKSEIDAENRARLKGMSPEEIIEAQEEITQKMNPALVNLLKKRGQEKLKQKQLPSSDEIMSGELSDALGESQSIKNTNVSLHARNDSADMMAVNTSTDTKTGQDDDLGPGKGSLWNKWSERVEAVRNMRFSLEGSVIADESATGDISGDNNDSTVNVSERDFLRTDGDPAAVGYSIKEAIELTRSVIPGQRALALHLLASILDNAIHNIQQNQVGCTMRSSNLIDKLVDWEAIWAYALGPEPELVLSLRLCLDDNHRSVVLSCARVIQCALSCDLNESFFNISEKLPTYTGDIFTGPVFRRKPEIDGRFLHGGFWKYSAKPSNILTFSENVNEDETEGEHTIQDDIVIASQDFTAGLVRMGILPRLRYLLEGDHNAALHESVVSILVAIARHSPTCANAVMKCQGLVHAVVHKFTMGDTTEINFYKIKSVTLIKVLFQADKKNCIEFMNNESFQALTQNLFRYTSSLDHWMEHGKESCKLSSALIVEQLRLWRSCINYGFCISYFSDIFPALCLWLNPPTFKKLKENNVLCEFVSISREAYLVLEALARKLPSLHLQEEQYNQIVHCASHLQENWSWSFVTPIVDLALKWIALKNDPCFAKYIEGKKGTGSCYTAQDLSNSSLLWVFSAVMHMLSTLLEKVKPAETMMAEGYDEHVPWLPEFVPKIGLEIVKNQIFSTSRREEPEHFYEDGAFVEDLCFLRKQNDDESSLAAVYCLHGLLRAITTIDDLIRSARSAISNPPSPGYSFSREEKILGNGILKSYLVDWRYVLNVFMKLIESQWHLLQSIETFKRGGPAPGVGVGWGASGGGFWSVPVLLAQADSRLLIDMVEIFQMMYSTEFPTDEEMASAMHMLNSILEACLTFGPRDGVVMDKALHCLLQVPVFRYFSLCTQHFIKVNKKMKPFSWEYEEEDYLLYSTILASHFKKRWLSAKQKLKVKDENNTSRNKSFRKGGVSLETIHEEFETSTSISSQEWAHQRLPLPAHWYFSPILGINDHIEVAKGGLFFILAMEVMSTFVSSNIDSPVSSIPLVWKFHSLSVALLACMDVLDDKKSRDVYEALQDIYGQLLDKARFARDEHVNLLLDKSVVEVLRFQSEIHESYSTFFETLVEQFSAVSYGDVIFGRQVSIYLHRSTEAPVRLHAWNALSNASVLEILPPVDQCIGEGDGYLEPIEDNEDILEAYVKSWVSGALDRSFVRGSMAFILVLHHLSSFIFLVCHDKMSVRNKLVKSLLRDCSQKQKHKAMMMELVEYSKGCTSEMPLQSSDIGKRFEILAEACERDSFLLTQVENLKSDFVKKHNVVT
ncbi:transcriptional elongation regulator MINIYO isoform X2 [Mercurialis annua]|uniref:transcriptional elongation regulator MINIYO isoform X2 n=1 Tax=Mercurialis annua TaxID=3986 RepID=UPI00215E5505|nr:transcriptional elongation regulator MINIYO isoform X2 [Mercurialis annua]